MIISQESGNNCFSYITGRFGRVIVIPKEGDNLLSIDAWAELRILDEIIRNATITFGEDKLTYK